MGNLLQWITFQLIESHRTNSIFLLASSNNLISDDRDWNIRLNSGIVDYMKEQEKKNGNQSSRLQINSKMFQFDYLQEVFNDPNNIIDLLRFDTEISFFNQDNPVSFHLSWSSLIFWTQIWLLFWRKQKKPHPAQSEPCPSYGKGNHMDSHLSCRRRRIKNWESNERFSTQTNSRLVWPNRFYKRFRISLCKFFFLHFCDFFSFSSFLWLFFCSCSTFSNTTKFSASGVWEIIIQFFWAFLLNNEPQRPQRTFIVTFKDLFDQKNAKSDFLDEKSDFFKPEDWREGGLFLISIVLFKVFLLMRITHLRFKLFFFVLIRE